MGRNIQVLRPEDRFRVGVAATIAKREESTGKSIDWDEILAFLAIHGFGSPKEVADTYTATEIVKMFEQAYKYEANKKADMLVLNRAAFHADKIDKLYKSITKHSRPVEQQTTSPEQFLAAFGG